MPRRRAAGFAGTTVKVVIGAIVVVLVAVALWLTTRETQEEASLKLFRSLDSRDVPEVNRILRAFPRLAEARNTVGMTPLLLAVAKRDVSMVETVIQHVGDVNKGGSGPTGTPLQWAVGGREPNARIISILLDRDAHVNERYGQDTPLMLAAKGGRLDCVQLLLSKGAEVNPRREGNTALTPLHYAVISGRSEVVSALIAKGANMDAIAGDGQTPLGLAIYLASGGFEQEPEPSSSADAARLALKTAALQSSTDTSRSDYAEVAEVLRKHGAKPATAATKPET